MLCDRKCYGSGRGDSAPRVHGLEDLYRAGGSLSDSLPLGGQLIYLRLFNITCTFTL